MRVQLARPRATVLTPEQYNQLFSMHGVTMIFLYALPMLSGFSNYLWPLMLGSRDMAFPRLNALSYWLFLAAGLFLYASFRARRGARRRLVRLCPANTRQVLSPGPNLDVYCLGLIFLGISTTVGSANFVVTLLRMRAPGHVGQPAADHRLGNAHGARSPTCSRCPRSASPACCCGSIATSARISSTSRGGGQPLLWQHLFWMFGHPWVYAVVLPAMGHGVRRAARSTAAARWSAIRWSRWRPSRRWSIGFGVWLHHMFATGVPALALSFFSAASFVIAIPQRGRRYSPGSRRSATGRARITTPFLFFTRLHPAVRHRRRVGRDDRKPGARLAADRHLFHRRPPALRR